TCFVELDPNSFENIAWRLEKQTYSIVVDPDILKYIEIPISIAGEASGYVFLESDGEKEGQGRIIVSFFDNDLNPVAKTLTEDDGYFSYFGLTSGKYYVRVDTAQLRTLNMISTPDTLQFTIAGGIDGDIADGLDFVLNIIPVDTTVAKPVIPGIPAVTKDTSYLILHELSEEVYTITEDSWAIQIGAFKSKQYAEGFEKMLEKELGKDVQITVEGEFYRVRILDLPTRKEVDENVVKLNKLGFKELWIIRLLARQQQRLLITREDSLARIKETLIEREVPLSAAEKAELQLNAFRMRTNTITLRKPLSALPVEKGIIERGGVYYKLETPDEPILDPDVLKAIDELLTSVGQFELEDSWTLPVKKELYEEPVEREPILIQKAVVRPDTSIRIVELEPEALIMEEKPETAQPSIALQVAVFYRESQALRAQKRIMTKLNLPVEIVKQFDYYHVIVTGFYSREETYQYYPELAGIGYPGITLIENYKRQK
ncbi:MAG: hypothetical protein H6Q23_1760, partial [Bacteroidetes bacterium]|nr:hypothetical protein [Bacteroidota bacterium]